MGIFNKHSSRLSGTISSNVQEGAPGPQGPPGIGFKLTALGNFDILNK